jgi:hypothetical protein
MTKSRTYTLGEALALVTSQLAFPCQQLGTKIIIGNVQEYAELTLSIVGSDEEMPTDKHYKYIRVRHFVAGRHSNTFSVNLSDKKYSPPNPKGDGGYYWSVIKQFYFYEPNLEVVTKDLTEILVFLNLPKN